MELSKHMNKNFFCISLMVIILSASLDRILAIPAFAKRYEKPCQTCHVSEPKLNAFGELFRANGFQLPGTIEDTPPWVGKKIQFSAMLHEMYIVRRIDNNMAATPPPGLPPGQTYDVNSFRDMGGHLWMAGTLGRKLSFFGTLGLESELDVSNGRFGTETHTHWDQAFFQYNNLITSLTHTASIKFGLFELELPFSPLRNLGSGLAPYEIYNIHGLKGAANLASTQTGISFNGLSYLGVNSIRYELAAINGTNANFDTNVEFDIYGRVAIARLFDGFLQRVQIGGLYYSGVQNLRDLPGNPFPNSEMIGYWSGDTTGKDSATIVHYREFLEFNGGPLNVHINPENSNFYRWGIDGSVDLILAGFPINIYGQYLVGHDDDIDMTNHNLPDFESAGEESGGGHGHAKILSEEDKWLTRPFDYSGGFIGADIVLIPTKLYFTPRFDWVSVTNQWVDKVDGRQIRDEDSMVRSMTNKQTEYSRYIIGIRYHPIMPVTIVFEWGVQDNLFGFPEPSPDMYNPSRVAGMGRVVDIDSDWRMLMVMFAF